MHCTLSLHDALPISPRGAVSTKGTSKPSDSSGVRRRGSSRRRCRASMAYLATSGPCSPISSGSSGAGSARSEEHTSELQSRLHLVCRLLLEKKKGESAAELAERLVVGVLVGVDRFRAAVGRRPLVAPNVRQRVVRVRGVGAPAAPERPRGEW